MGIILGPLMLFWIGASIYSLRIGYVLLIDKALYPYVLSVLLTAALAMLAYVYIGLSGFKREKQMWAFEIPWFFTAKPFAFIAFLLALLVHIYAGEYMDNEYVKLVPFIIMFTISIGAIVGSFSTNSFMTRYNIKSTY